jgi:hypothetical protein
VRPVTVTVGPVGTVSATNIALSQTPSAAGALTLNGSTVSGGVATLSSPQRVKITTADSTHTFTITGATASGSVLSEVVTSNGTSVQSALDYATVTSIVISGAATGAVTVGTSGVASTPWVRFDDFAPAPVSIQCTVSGTVNYTIQQTLDDPNSATNPVTPSAVTWVATSDTAGVGATGSIQSNYGYVPIFARVLLNSGAGSVTTTFLQAGAVPY